MSGEKRFRSSMFGYKKQDVYEFIEKLAKDLEEQIKIKDDELVALRNQNQDLKKQVEELTNKLTAIESGRTYIADAIIKAEEQAKKIIDDAVREAGLRRQELQLKINEEQNKLEMVKKELRELRLEAIDRIKRYELQLVELVEEEEIDATAETEQEAAVTQEEEVEQIDG
ncbi:MAG: hypothetical protein PWR27_1015 [Petroclostridium sp.]|jgi:cell division initiation protein|uniref:DivIVA domain-containing protein n=1 Tax=Petroclostridium xylanilyticum TaxID=1792311 RepID=UPI000B992D06|nr:DivIVA domain-containing protein [Petroclostridium xylanilyticum]MBZ4645028.1 DivIVA protein [Clostridia bacterium]MDK2810306.1 hypothetical protein [Petroclostridium sp.]